MALTTIPVELVTLDDGVTITVDDNSDNLTLTSTDADANAGPNLRMYRNSSSPADADVLGVIDYEGRNDNSQDVVYASITAQANDVSDGSEDGSYYLSTMVGGTLRNRMNVLETETVFNQESLDLDFRIESDGDANCFFIDGGKDTVLLGTNTSRTNWYNSSVYGASLQIEGLATNTRYLAIGAVTNSNDSNGAYIGLGSSRGTSVNSVTVVQQTDYLGSISFQGADGTDLVVGADISAQVALTPGANDMPTRLQFRTTPDGAASPTERMQLQHDGALRIGGTAFGNITGGMNYFTLADDATKTIALSGTATAGGALMVIYESGSGDNALVHVGYGTNSIVSQTGSTYVTSDTDAKFCVIVSGHNISFKNRIGTSRNFNLMVYGAGNFNYNL
jgi:hypothetical protein